MKSAVQTSREPGFTIIEVILFLAISAILTITILGSWTLTVNTQSYKDSASTFASYLQRQLSLVSNVSNEREGTVSCQTSGGSTTVGGAGTELPRGASNCVVLGRYIFIDGTNLTSWPVLGYESTSIDLTTDASETELLALYNPSRATVEDMTNEDQIAWSTRPFRPGQPDQTVREAIVMLRSPVTGGIRTYHRTVAPNATTVPRVQQVLAAGNSTARATYCLDAGTPVLSETLAVVVRENASSQSAIEVLGNESESQCD